MIKKIPKSSGLTLTKDDSQNKNVAQQLLISGNKFWQFSMGFIETGGYCKNSSKQKYKGEYAKYYST